MVSNAFEALLQELAKALQILPLKPDAKGCCRLSAYLHSSYSSQNREVLLGRKSAIGTTTFRRP